MNKRLLPEGIAGSGRDVAFAFVFHRVFEAYGDPQRVVAVGGKGDRAQDDYGSDQGHPPAENVADVVSIERVALRGHEIKLGGKSTAARSCKTTYG